MTECSETEINLKTLQRVDPNIIEIIDNASQVALYKYERKLEEWEGTDIEGTLFLYQRSMYPYHGFIIMNRMNTTNFLESITSDMQLQLQDPYLLYKNRSGDIMGTWFYEQKDLWRISKQIQMIVLKQASTSKRQRCASESETLPRRENVQDIITLLSDAHKKYVKNISATETLDDINNLSSYCEKQSFQKSIGSFEGRRLKFLDRSVSCDDTVSLRRRFPSAGTFSNSHLPLDKISNIHGNEIQEEKKTINKNGRHLPIPSCPSPLFRHDEAASPISDVGFLDDSFDMAQPEVFSSIQKYEEGKTETTGLDNCQMNNKTDLHLMSIQQALKLHIEGNPKILLKLHEAYISGLRSLFTKN